MGILDNFKGFLHSITTEDHYASYDSPYKNSVINNDGNTGGDRSGSRLHELNRLATVNSSSHSLMEGSRNGSSANVGYRPGMRSSGASSSGELPMQSLNAAGEPPLPSIDSMIDRFESWLEEEYPELGDNLNDGVTTADLNEFENDLGCGPLPLEFRQFYKRHDGQFLKSKPTGIIMGFDLLDLESIVEEHAIWARVAERLERQQFLMQKQTQAQEGSSSSEKSVPANSNFVGNQRSVPPNSVQPYYSHKGWIPFVKDDCGNQIALDLSPGTNGKWGQVIIFGREFDTKVVVASSFQEFVFTYITDLENGNYLIDHSTERESFGYLESSRDDDYMIGDDEEDQGELAFIDKDGKEFGKALRGKLTYIEALKRRALKKYGLSESYSTSYVPPRANSKRPVNKSTTSLRSQSPSASLSNVSRSSAAAAKSQNPTKIAVAKETLIDDTTAKKPEDPAPAEKKETPSEETELDSKAETVEPSADAPAEAAEPESKPQPSEEKEVSDDKSGDQELTPVAL